MEHKTATQVRFKENLYEKIRATAKAQNRSINNQINHIAEQYINDYEKINGTITIEETK